MEEIIVEEIINKTVQVQRLEKVTKYKTKDGKIFSSREKALKHEIPRLSRTEFCKKFKVNTINLENENIESIFIEVLDGASLTQLNDYYRRSLNFHQGLNLLSIDNSSDYETIYILDINSMEQSLIKDLKTIQDLKAKYNI